MTIPDPQADSEGFAIGDAAASKRVAKLKKLETRPGSRSGGRDIFDWIITSICFQWTWSIQYNTRVKSVIKP